MPEMYPLDVKHQNKWQGECPNSFFSILYYICIQHYVLYFPLTNWKSAQFQYRWKGLEQPSI